MRSFAVPEMMASIQGAGRNGRPVVYIWLDVKVGGWCCSGCADYRGGASERAARDHATRAHGGTVSSQVKSLPSGGKHHSP